MPNPVQYGETIRSNTAHIGELLGLYRIHIHVILGRSFPITEENGTYWARIENVSAGTHPATAVLNKTGYDISELDFEIKVRFERLIEGDEINLITAINRSLHEIMEADETTVLFGQDVADASRPVLARA